MRWRPLARRVAALVAALVALTILAGLLFTQTDWGRRRTRNLIQTQAARVFNGEVRIGEVRGSFLRGVLLSDVVLANEGQDVVRIGEASIRYSLIQLLRGEAIEIDELGLTDVSVSGRRTPSGPLNLSQLMKARAPSGRPGRPITIRRITVEKATITFDDAWGPSWAQLPRRITDLKATLALTVRDGIVTLPIASLAAQGTRPDLLIRHFTGTVTIGGQGWSVDKGALGTARSTVTFTARTAVDSGQRTYDVRVAPSTVDFPELSAVLPGVRTIDDAGSLQLTMSGPENRLATDAAIGAPSGDIRLSAILDSTVPGWKGAGTATFSGVDVSRWLPTTSVSRITGRVDFDLLLGLGRHFPRGTFNFSGPHAMFVGYEASPLAARGRLTADRAELAAITGTAYGSPVNARGWIAIAAPYDFHLIGHARGLDLRKLPPTVPAPKIETALTMAFDATGRFQDPYLTGTAVFERSIVLGAEVNAGARASLDTSTLPTRYAATGHVANLDLATVGRAFVIETLTSPEYAGVVTGHFDIEGVGTTMDEVDMRVGLRDATASLFGGEFRASEFQGTIWRDTIRGKLTTTLAAVDPAAVAGDPRFAGRVSGVINVDLDLPGIFSTGPDVATMRVSGTADLRDSRIGEIDVRTANLEGSLAKGTVQVSRAVVSGPVFTGEGSGTIPLAGGDAAFTFRARAADLATLRPWLPVAATGSAEIEGTATGPYEQLVIRGKFTGNNVAASDVRMLTATGDFDATVPAGRIADASIKATIAGTFLQAGGWSAPTVTARLSYGSQQLRGDVGAVLADGRRLSASGALAIHTDHQELHLESGAIQIGDQRWQVADDAGDAVVSWDAAAIHVRNVVLVSPSAKNRVTIQGSLGRNEPAGTITIDAVEMPVESLGAFVPQMAGYRGTLKGRINVAGTLTAPTITANLSVVKGSFRDFSFDSLTVDGRLDQGDFDGKVRLDQAAGRWLTINGRIPSNVFSAVGPSRPLDLSIKSSPIDLSVVEGFTDAVSDVSGVLEIDVRATGVSTDPHVDGFVRVTGAAFTVPLTGASYRNGDVRITLVPDSVLVDSFRIEDDKGDPLELSGGATTHELRLGTFSAELSATRFEVLQNAMGDVDLNGVLTISGTPAAPVISGDLAIHRGDLAADRLLEYFDRPYATTALAPSATVDAATAAVQRWWDRASLRLRLLATNNLAFRGDALRFRAGSAAGLGNVNVTFGGDVTLRKQPAESTTLVGVLTTDRGSYAFQGRRFTIEKGGTIRFMGDASAPLISIAAERTVSGVQIRAAVRGTTTAPELQLSSRPGLEESDILSLLLFGVPTNELAAGQREEVAFQAASLASGFVVSPAITAIGRALGLDYLDLERGNDPSSPNLRLSAGREVWPGVFLTYGREFGTLEYNEFMIEYSLSRFLKLRGTLTDADGARSRASLFRRIERGGMDLIFSFSY